MTILKRVLVAEIQARLSIHLPIPGLVSFVHKYAIADQPQIQHMELLNEFIKLMTSDMFLHESPGYWLMRINGTWGAGADNWTQKTIDDNDDWLHSLTLCKTPFSLMHLYRIDFSATASVEGMIWAHADSLRQSWTIRRGDRYEESADRVTAEGWWPVLLVVSQ